MKQASSGTDVFAYVQLSPALRNRFTEIWCPQSNSRNDLTQIIQHNLRPGLSLDQHDHQGESLCTEQSIIKSLILHPLKYFLDSAVKELCINATKLHRCLLFLAVNLLHCFSLIIYLSLFLSQVKT